MNCEVLSIPPFDKQLKRLSKKYFSLKEDLTELVQSLSVNPRQGIQLGNNCYKIRLSIISKAKGKSGGARIITYVQVIERTVYLISIFDKSDQENIADKELKFLLKWIKDE